MIRWLCVATSLVFCATLVQSADISVPARPGALEEILNTDGVKAGDRLMLAAGDHGVVSLRNIRFSNRVLVRPAGGKVTLRGLRLHDVDGLAVVGVTVQSDGSDDAPLVRIQDGSNIVLQQLNVSGGTGFERWSKTAWLARMRIGMLIKGANITLRDNRIEGVRHGFEVRGDRITLEGNVVRWFAGDGIRALADNSVYRSNVIETCVKLDDHHDDGIQSWSVDANGQPGRGVVRNVLIEGNTIRNGRAGRGLTCQLQGIGFFDGMFENLTIRRNVVIVDSWHGITVMGARRVRIEDNLVVDANPEDNGSPWVTITEHKDGRAVANSVISGNIAQAIGAPRNETFTQPRRGVDVRGNTEVATPEAGIRIWNSRN